MVKAYISATLEDLRECRQAVRNALSQLEIGYKTIEVDSAEGRAPLERCLADIDSCEIYIGIFAWQYGYIPPGETKSITHLEFQHAAATGKHCLIYLLDDKASWQRRYVDTGADAAKIEELRRIVSASYLCKFFTSADQLALQVVAAVTHYIADTADRGAAGPGDAVDSDLPLPGLPSLVMPGFAGETKTGEELLGISQDALSLAILISSASLKPPLAIGVHGAWGSGKTFFMNILNEHLSYLSESTSESAFCRRIASVWFNAWHYAESDLWASLLYEIYTQMKPPVSAPEHELAEARTAVQNVRAEAAEVAGKPWPRPAWP